MPSYFMLNKPPGCISARRDWQGRATIYDHVPKFYPPLPHVGRLDYNSEGLLLFTDDGRLAQALLNKGFRNQCAEHEIPPVQKVYHVKVRPILQEGDERLVRLCEPLDYHDNSAEQAADGTEGSEKIRYTTEPAQVRIVAQRTRSTWVEVIINEGRFRQVRHLCDRSGLQIVKLRRVQLGPLVLGELKLRWCRPLTEGEIRELYAAALPTDDFPVIIPIGGCS